jgi:hypothetical protein
VNGDGRREVVWMRKDKDEDKWKRNIGNGGLAF